jgi:hypothetical protein
MVGTLPAGPTVQDFERIGRLAPTRISRREAEMLLGEGLRDDVTEYVITRGDRALRIQHFAETPTTRPFWVIWFPDGSGISVYDWRWVVRFEEGGK